MDDRVAAEPGGVQDFSASASAEEITALAGLGILEQRQHAREMRLDDQRVLDSGVVAGLPVEEDDQCGHSGNQQRESDH